MTAPWGPGGLRGSSLACCRVLRLPASLPGQILALCASILLIVKWPLQRKHMQCVFNSQVCTERLGKVSSSYYNTCQVASMIPRHSMKAGFPTHNSESETKQHEMIIRI